ncbi:MAG: cadmium resistance transporter, partial [Oscillospiraceae bacterium]|nr:cadmium resistance transporter [Oscillospiraceae bacterium]
AFAASNIDDLFVLMLLFGISTKKSAVRRGYLLASLCVCAFSLLAAFTLQNFALAYIKLLGVVPLFLGIKAAIGSDGDDDELPESSRFACSQALQTFLFTLVGSADNIGLYIPLFASFEKGSYLLAFAAMMAMALLWCHICSKLSSLPALQKLLAEKKRLATSVIYIALGIYILIG